MTTTKGLYAAAASVDFSTAVTTLANGSAVISDVFDNSANLYLDAMFYASITIASGTIGSDKLINIWMAISEDGTHFTGTRTNSVDSIAAAPYAGVAGAFTLQAPTQLLGAFQHAVPTSNVQTDLIIPSLRDIVGGLILPKKFALVVENRTGLAFTAFTDSGGNAHKGEWTGINLSNV